MTEDTVRADALSVHDGRLAVAVHLPWYRSLPVSCLESIAVTVDGAVATVRSVHVPGFDGTVGEAAGSDAWWDLRDPLDVRLDTQARTGDVVPIEVGIGVRIPYIQQAPGVPLVQRAVVRTEGIAR